jgi:AcrR family transcriptional regulator
MSRTRAADYEQSRDAILLTAVRAFAVLGYPSASMADIAQNCGTSKAALYHYYPSKEALLFDSLNRYTLRLVNIAATATTHTDSNTDQLKALITAFLVEYETSNDFHVALLHDIKFLSVEQQTIIRSQERQVLDKFADVIRRSFPDKITDDNLKPLTMSLLGSINFTFAWLKRDGSVSYRQYAQWIADLWIAGLSSNTFNANINKPSEIPL